MTCPANHNPAAGRRQIVTYNTTGQPHYAVQDLTPSDFLNPQPGDEFFHGDRHDELVAYIVGCFHHLYRYSPFVAVLSGAKLIWDDPALPQPMPDLAVVADLADPHRYRSTLDMAVEGARPRFILEVTSPRLAHIDLVEKHDLYARARVQEYFVVQPLAPSSSEQTTLRVAAFRLEQAAYQPIDADSQSRVYSTTSKVWFLATDDNLQIIEERTGTVITPPDDIHGEPSAATQIEATLRAQSIASKLNLGR